ncbi:hypothetical protein E0L13_10640 [Megasphaera sp. SW808]|uniref:hypothetical protein n=1 Tax=Megasphaera sp. SW808 TaxID=2530045 RepID=UPI00143A2A46|nr:hypothetical protein [Megasphaera sp. SW808]NJE35471.1 hypothetical protein [Megasphaera sp. SW808]
MTTTTTQHEQHILDAIRRYEIDWEKKYQPDNFRSMHAHVIYESGWELFYSYQTLVGVRTQDKYYFKDKTFSPTTSKQLTAWSGVNTAARRQGIKSGVFGSF